MNASPVAIVAGASGCTGREIERFGASGAAARHGRLVADARALRAAAGAA